jgi:RNA polymerase sigma-70 factor, ECF subfamily
MHPADEAQVDIALLSRIAARDTGAVGELYDRHNRLLYGLILRILRDRAEAEEILQETFVQAWTRASAYDVALGLPLAWLVRIAQNRAIDRLRANSARLRALEAAPIAGVPRESPELRASMTEQQKAVASALGSLPTEQRELIEQAYLFGFTQSELAERHKLPLGTVKTRIRTGMMALRQQLSQIAM